MQPGSSMPQPAQKRVSGEGEEKKESLQMQFHRYKTKRHAFDYILWSGFEPDQLEGAQEELSSSISLVPSLD